MSCRPAENSTGCPTPLSETGASPLVDPRRKPSAVAPLSAATSRPTSRSGICGWHGTKTSTSTSPPTHASWLNQVEIWFSIVARSTLDGANFTSVQHLRQAIDAFIERYNQHAAPFRGRTAARSIPNTSPQRITDL